MAELVALEDNQGRWRILHAMAPPTKKFRYELGMMRR